MNKILKTLLTVVLFFTVGTVVNAEGDGTLEASDSTVVATVDGHGFPSIKDAIEYYQEVGGGKTIEVVENTTEDINIPSGTTFTLDIKEGVTITNSTTHTIINNGTLTIKGSGTVDNVTHAKAALYNKIGATATLEGNVKYTRSREAGDGASNSNGGNSWYYISNQGTMTIKDTTTVVSEGTFSSLIRNGGEGDASHKAKLTVENGILSGGKNTIKNDVYSELYIKGGQFSNSYQCNILNWEYAEISGGTFIETGTAKDSIWIGKSKESDEYTTQGKTVITNGTFNGGLNQHNKRDEDGSYEISGGIFVEDVSKYLVAGNQMVKVGDKYKVVTDGTDTVVVTANTLAYDETIASNIKSTIGEETGFNKDDVKEITSYAALIGEKYDSKTFTQAEWNYYNERYSLEDKIKEQENVNSIVPILLGLSAKDANDKNATIDELNTASNFTLYLNENALNSINGKKFTLYRVDMAGDNAEFVAVTDEKTTVKGNSISFSANKLSLFVIVTYDEVSPSPTPTPTPTATVSSTTKKSTGGWDDGGPFTTDTCGNVFDRWGNKIYEAKGCNVGGYNLVRTSVED